MGPWITYPVLVAACFMCTFSQQTESYECITGETCVKEGNFTFANVDGTNYCCNYGDSLTTKSIKNGVTRTSFFLNTKRDATSDGIGEKTINCSCNAVDIDAIKKEMNEKFELATAAFWEDWNFWPWD